jgi:tetratricopeptide (TPR) repeat protein
LGEIALDQGNVAKAKTIFELASTSSDLFTRQAALMGLGDVQMFTGDLAQAKQYYGEAAVLDAGQGTGAWARYQIGRIDFQAGQIKEAIERFKPLADADDNDLADEAHLALALAYLANRQPELAKLELETLKAVRGGRPVARRADYYLALLALHAGDREQALSLCREVVAQAPSSEEAVDARVVLADAIAEEQSVEEAMRWLEEALAAPGLPARHRAKLARRLGDLAREVGESRAAIAHYRQAQQFLPAIGAEMEYVIASAYEEEGEIPQAIEAYRQIRQMPWRVRGQLAAAKLLERHGRPEEAEAIYEALAAESIPEAQAVKEHLAALRSDGGKRAAR